jgi:transposase
LESLSVERLDHLGIVAGVIKDLKIVEMIDARIPQDEQEHISTGETIAGMILNGLGFSNRPLSLTPQFFANKPLGVLFRSGVKAPHFNHYKLGRSLDDAFDYGLEQLFSEISLSVCQSEGIDLQFNHLDTSSFSLTGEYLPDLDEHAVMITQGYSKDHRPDLKQAVAELMISQDGGVPTLYKCWDGNASDNTIFKERSRDLIQQFKAGDSPRYLIMDSKGYTKANAANLRFIPFITRVPATISVAGTVIQQALKWDEWRTIDENYQYQTLELGHYGIDQRWVIVRSKGAWERASKTIDKKIAKENKAADKQLFHLQAERFASEDEARYALKELEAQWRYHQVHHIETTQHIQYACKGRPTPDSPIKAIKWQIKTDLKVNMQQADQDRDQKSCFVLATSISALQLNDEEVFWGYKAQSHVERGFRFLKDPLFFASSLFVKKPYRIEGMLMVMTLALLVYAIAQRRMRHELKRLGTTLPNQVGKPVQNPTLRWVFQLLEGIDCVNISFHGEIRCIINGLNDIRRKILTLFGQTVAQIYQISPD